MCFVFQGAFWECVNVRVLLFVLLLCVFTEADGKSCQYLVGNRVNIGFTL